MTTQTALAAPSDVIDLLSSAARLDQARLGRLIEKASRKLRHDCPFDIDARIATYAIDPDDPLALDPAVVADRVAIIVKRFLTNVEGVASTSQSAGPFSQSRTFVNRYDKTGSDVRGELRITEEDIDELRPAVTFTPPGVARVNLPRPEVLIPAGGRYAGVRAGGVPAVVDDVTALDNVSESGAVQ